MSKSTPAAKAVQWAKRHCRPMDSTVIKAFLAGRKEIIKTLRITQAQRDQQTEAWRAFRDQLSAVAKERDAMEDLLQLIVTEAIRNPACSTGHVVSFETLHKIFIAIDTTKEPT